MHGIWKNPGVIPLRRKYILLCILFHYFLQISSSIYILHETETMTGLRNKFLKWKNGFESKGLKVNFRNTKVMVSGGITKDGMSKSKVDPCGVCSLRIKANSVLCVQCVKWIQGRCAGV